MIVFARVLHRPRGGHLVSTSQRVTELSSRLYAQQEEERGEQKLFGFAKNRAMPESRVKQQHEIENN